MATIPQRNWPRINGRRFLGTCYTREEAEQLAFLYPGAHVEIGGLMIEKKEISQGTEFARLIDHDLHLTPGYSVFIDPTRFGEMTAGLADHQVQLTPPNPLLFNG